MVESIIGAVKIRIRRGIDLAVRDLYSSDPYVVVAFGKGSQPQKPMKTRVVKSNCNHVWNEEFTLPFSDSTLSIKLSVFDHEKNKMTDREAKSAKIKASGQQNGKVDAVVNLQHGFMTEKGHEEGNGHGSACSMPTKDAVEILAASSDTSATGEFCNGLAEMVYGKEAVKDSKEPDSKKGDLSRKEKTLVGSKQRTATSKGVTGMTVGNSMTATAKGEKSMTEVSCSCLKNPI